MTAESFDAVLAEMRSGRIGVGGRRLSPTVTNFADRLQSANAAEVAEVRQSARHEAVAMGLLADRAVGLLRECLPYMPAKGLPATVTARVSAFLSEQAGERENGDG